MGQGSGQRRRVEGRARRLPDGPEMACNGWHCKWEVSKRVGKGDCTGGEGEDDWDSCGPVEAARSVIRPPEGGMRLATAGVMARPAAASLKATKRCGKERAGRNRKPGRAEGCQRGEEGGGKGRGQGEEGAVSIIIGVLNDAINEMQKEQNQKTKRETYWGYSKGYGLRCGV